MNTYSMNDKQSTCLIDRIEASLNNERRKFLKCEFILKGGQRSGKLCGKYTSEKYCHNHRWKFEGICKRKCKHLFVKGKKRGTICNANVKGREQYGYDLCCKHKIRDKNRHVLTNKQLIINKQFCSTHQRQSSTQEDKIQLELNNDVHYRPFEAKNKGNITLNEESENPIIDNIEELLKEFSFEDYNF